MDDDNRQPRRYWEEIRQLKGQIEYLHLYEEGSERADHRINLFLAVTSNGSIAGWAVWQELQLVWAGVIAASQLVNAVKSYLPYSRRVKSLREVNSALHKLLLEHEGRWYEVAEGRLSNDEINDLVVRLRKDKLEITDRHLQGISLPTKPRLVREAETKTNAYFDVMYMQKTRGQVDEQEAE